MNTKCGTRGAFTLVEALLATALLAVLSAASAGLLRDAARLAHPNSTLDDSHAEAIVLLSLIVDLALEDPERAGLTNAPSWSWDGARLGPSAFGRIKAIDEFEIPFDDVVLRLIVDAPMSSDESGRHVDAWLIFAASDSGEHSSVEVARRVRLPIEASP